MVQIIFGRICCSVGRSDLLVRSRVRSACQIRFKSNLWFRSYLVGYTVQTILGQICWSDQLVGSVVQIMFGRICCSEHLLGQICWSDQYFRGRICWSDHVSDLPVRSRVGSACQIRFKSNLWFRSYLVGYAVQTILGQICWSDELVGSGKSDLWFTSCLVGSVVQIIYWVRSAG